MKVAAELDAARCLARPHTLCTIVFLGNSLVSFYRHNYFNKIADFMAEINFHAERGTRRRSRLIFQKGRSACVWRRINFCVTLLKGEF
jgi:hypothetical protein